MTEGTSQSIFIVVAIVIFGLFVTMSYTVFADTLQPSLVEIFKESFYQEPKETDSNYFIFEESTGTITGYKNSGPKDVGIPEQIDGITVKHIGSRAFNIKDIQSISIPNTVVSLGERAFYQNFIEHVKIPDSVQSIGEYAFAYNNIYDLTLPDTLGVLQTGAFERNNISEVVLPHSLKVLNTQIFMNNRLKSVEIYDTVTMVGYMSFAENKLKDVSLPKGAYISDTAFDSKVERTIRE